MAHVCLFSPFLTLHRCARIMCPSKPNIYICRCSGNVHSQPDRLGHDLGPFNRPDKSLHGSQRSADSGAGSKRDAKKAKLAARTLPSCARRAEGFLKTMKILKHKVLRINRYNDDKTVCSVVYVGHGSPGAAAARTGLSRFD